MGSSRSSSSSIGPDDWSQSITELINSHHVVEHLSLFFVMMTDELFESSNRLGDEVVVSEQIRRDGCVVESSVKKVGHSWFASDVGKFVKSGIIRER